MAYLIEVLLEYKKVIAIDVTNEVRKFSFGGALLFALFSRKVSLKKTILKKSQVL